MESGALAANPWSTVVCTPQMIMTPSLGSPHIIDNRVFPISLHINSSPVGRTIQKDIIKAILMMVWESNTEVEKNCRSMWVTEI